MEIIAENIGKKFNKEWIFRNLSLSLKNNQSLAITGPNGSGKSTLLQILAGAIPSSEGKINYLKGKQFLPPDYFYMHISYASPYLELIEEMNIRELSDFHKGFKSFSNNISTEEFLAKIMLEHASEKEIRFLSSGMKQRVKLGLALFSDTPILMLDEPTTNLDSKGTDWYLEEINKQVNNRIIIVSSNQHYEYNFCEEVIKIRN
jgi:ABC-type multidrug transport system ATPase subunit